MTYGRTLATLAVAAGLAACAVPPSTAIECSRCTAWNEPQPAFRIHGRTWYVGTRGLAVILIDSGDGLVLIDGGLPQSGPRIEASVDALGFSLQDVRYILLSHAHFDHAGGLAYLAERAPQAQVVVGADALATVREGRVQPDDPLFAPNLPGATFPAVPAATAVDADVGIRAGDLHVRAIPSPGHTTGGTTWTWTSCDDGDCLEVVYADSLGTYSNGAYQFSATDLGSAATATIATIAALDCDILLAPHSSFFDLRDKLQRPADPNPFVDATACRRYAASGRAILEKRLSSERVP